MRLFNISIEKKHQIGNTLFSFMTSKIVFWIGVAFCLYGIEYNPFDIDKHPVIVAFVYSAVYGLSWAVITSLVMLLDVED
jgi:hypothetical protein